MKAAEIIVVDDGSTDATSAIAASFPVTLMRTPHRGPARARNEGAAIAKGQILAFVDADIECSSVYLQHLVSPILEGK